MKNLLTILYSFLSIAIGLSSCSKGISPETLIPANAGLAITSQQLKQLDSLDMLYKLIPQRANPAPLLTFLKKLNGHKALELQPVIFIPDRNSCLLIIDIEGIFSPQQLIGQIEVVSGAPSTVYNYKGSQLYKAGTVNQLYFTIVGNLLLVGSEAVLIEAFLAGNQPNGRWTPDTSDEEEALGIYIKPDMLITLYSGYLSPGGKRVFQRLADKYQQINLTAQGMGDWKLKGFARLRTGGTAHSVSLTSEELMTVLQQSSVRSGHISFSKFDWQKMESAGDNQYFIDYLLPWIGEEAAVFKSIATAGLQTDGLIFRVRDKIQAANSLELIKNQWALGEPESYGMFSIIHLEMPAMFSFLENDSAGSDFNYLVLLDNYVLLAKSRTFMELFLEDILAGNTMIRNENVLEDIGGFGTSIAEMFYLNPFFMSDCFSDKRFKKGFGGLELCSLVSGKTSDLEVQLSVNSHKKQTEGRIAGQKIWSTHLRSAAMTQPAIVDDRIVIQGVDNVLYCLDISGKLIWETRLSGAILGQIKTTQISGQSVLFFNTAGEIIIVKMDGSFMPGYPRTLSSVATGPLTAVDFGHNGEFVFFLPSGDRIFGFDLKGEPFVGWNPLVINATIEHPLGHFQFKGEDFFYLLDSIPSLRVFNKFGEPVFPGIELEEVFLSPPQHQIDPSGKLQGGNRIVSCNARGKVKVINPGGQHFNLRLPCGENSQTRFVFADFTGDERKDYLAASGRFVSLSAYDALRFETRFEQQLSGDISHIFSLDNPCGDKQLIGVLSFAAQQAYLLQPDGNPFPFFPLAATQPFELIFTEGCDGMTIIAVNADEVYAVR